MKCHLNINKRVPKLQIALRNTIKKHEDRKLLHTQRLMA